MFFVISVLKPNKISLILKIFIMKQIFNRLFLFTAIFCINFLAFSQKNIELTDIWVTYKFMPKSIYSIQNYPLDQKYTVLEGQKINLYNFKTGKLDKTIFDLNDAKIDSIKRIEEYSFNADASKILLGTNIQGIYRHSQKGDYIVYDFNTKKSIKLKGNGNVRLPDFSPNSNKIAYLRDNNLYVCDLSNNSELQITKDGEQNRIINGTTDWVYEEEFGFTKAFFGRPMANTLLITEWMRPMLRSFQ